MGFDEESTTDEVLEGHDLSGRTALVTGATGGIGIETARALASVGARVVVTGRTDEKRAAALATIRDQVPDADVVAVGLELASLADVRRAAGEVESEVDRLDLLIANAGIMATPFGRTADGHEQQFGTNHLGHFLLVSLLTPMLLDATPSRAVILTSGGHASSAVDFDDPDYERRPYDKWQAYGQAKTANALHALELDRRHGDAGLHAWSVHPGVIGTDLSRHLTRDDMTELLARIPKGGATKRKTVAQGAATTVWAATAPELVDHGGAYLEHCRVAVARSDDRPGEGVADHARDPAAAERLWELSERLVGP